MPSPPILPRDPYGAPRYLAGEQGISSDLRHRILILHPDYTTGATLLVLQAFDHSTGGFHYETACVACGIIAGNRWDGYLSNTRDGPEVDIPKHAVLPPGRYYFQLPRSQRVVQDIDGEAVEEVALNPTQIPYPIIPTFRDWPFPHDNLPNSWSSQLIKNLEADPTPRRSQLSSALAARDATCRLSGYQEQTTVAHICPLSESLWFQTNDMQSYTSNVARVGTRALDDTSNVMLLRQDIHTMFDAHRLTFVPKSHNEFQEAHIMAHVLATSSELANLYHNVTLKELKGVSIEFLFARFALSVFSYLNAFLEANTSRELLTGGVKLPAVRTVSPGECMIIAKPPRIRNSSPKKRPPPETENDDVEEQSVEMVEQICERLRCRKRRRTESLFLPVDARSQEPKGQSEQLNVEKTKSSTRQRTERWLVPTSDDAGVETEFKHEEYIVDEVTDRQRCRTEQCSDSESVIQEGYDGGDVGLPNSKTRRSTSSVVAFGGSSPLHDKSSRHRHGGERKRRSPSPPSLSPTLPMLASKASSPSDTDILDATNTRSQIQSGFPFSSLNAKTSAITPGFVSMSAPSESSYCKSPSSPQINLHSLIHTHLQSERNYSDPTGSWAREQEWLDEAIKGRPLCAWEVPRLMKGLWGYENRDEMVEGEDGRS